MAMIAMTTSSSMRVKPERRKTRFETAFTPSGLEVVQAKVACILFSEPTIQSLPQGGGSVQWTILFRTWRMLVVLARPKEPAISGKNRRTKAIIAENGRKAIDKGGAGRI